ncbi:MAG: polymer-forming cytoskeletal protein [Lachnospiraceae bacterium]|nr:polymer-forming cytoskeletal protein [Lachnospiraceae bacterium]
MGFFSDLKEDLSTSVNDFMPSEEEVTQEVAPEAALVEEVPEKTQDVSGELESLLDKMEEAPAPEPAPQKPAPSFVGRIASDETALITAGMSIKGDITSDGSLDVIGSIEGNIDILGKLNVTGTVLGNSKAMEVYAENAKITGEIKSEGSVKIGQSTVVIGNLFATSAVIAGAVKGDIDVHGPVILDTSAIVMGNIKSKSVQINNGAVIEGMCSQCYAEVNPTSFFDGIKQKGKNK